MNLQENKTQYNKYKKEMNRLNLFRCKLVPIGKERTTELKDTKDVKVSKDGKVAKDAKIFPIVPHILNFDGCSKGNPGLAGIGAVIYNEGEEIWASSKFIGTKTNNYSEYSALIFGLREALRLGIECLCVLGDSLLVINQLNGIYRVKSEDLLELYEEAVRLKNLFKYIEFNHIYREKNKRADELSNIALLQEPINDDEDEDNEVENDDLVEVVLLEEIPMKRPSKRIAKLTATKIDSFFPKLVNIKLTNTNTNTNHVASKKQSIKPLQYNLTSIL
jgi:ribonuclease HI